MSSLAKAIRSHRDMSRTRRAVNRAISQAVTPAMRDELIFSARRQGGLGV